MTLEEANKKQAEYHEYRKQWRDKVTLRQFEYLTVSSYAKATEDKGENLVTQETQNSRNRL